MNPKTSTSDLILDLEESVGTGPLETIGSEYVKLPVKRTPAEPTRAVILYVDEWRRTYVLEQVGRVGGRVHMDCRRRDFPDWLETGDGPEVIARLVAHERTIVDVAAPSIALEIEIGADRLVNFHVGELFWGRRLDGDR